MSSNRLRIRVRAALASEDHAASPAPATSRSLLAFVALTYAVTWVVFIGAGLLPAGWAGLRLPLLLVGSFAPSGVAVALTARARGRTGVRGLVGRLLHWRVQLRWYVFAVGFLAAVKLAVAVLYRVADGAWPHVGGEAWYAIVPAIVAAGILGGPLGEELGWRGYALPRLAERFGPATGSLVLGPIWASWHLPLFFMSGLAGYGDQYGQSFPTYLLQVTALSVALAWLVGNTAGSLLLAVLMHSAINQTKDIVSSRVPGASDMWGLSTSTTAWLTVALLWACAAYFLTHMPTTAAMNGRLERAAPRQGGSDNTDEDMR
ncbi:MAG: protease family protein [Nocardioidaceae bacterium]|jgi:membrane protease YdiL (CAAX protease family)|nr:protease family protein [Nocardioidaceae bacterium]